jgi:hypothetical protein
LEQQKAAPLSSSFSSSPPDGRLVARRPPCADNQILPLIAAISWQR